MLFTVLFVGLLAGIVLLMTGSTSLGLALVIVTGGALLLLGLVLVIGLVAMMSDGDFKGRKR